MLPRASLAPADECNSPLQGAAVLLGGMDMALPLSSAGGIAFPAALGYHRHIRGATRRVTQHSALRTQDSLEVEACSALTASPLWIGGRSTWIRSPGSGRRL